MAMRSTEVGADTAMYERIYQMIGQSNSLGKAINNAPLTAPVYVCFCWILSHISCQPQMLIFASSFFITIGLFAFIRKTSSNIVISSICWIGLTMLYASMNGHRQFMAIVIVLNAFYYLSENLADKKGWTLMLIATGIHISAIFSMVALIGVALANKLKKASNIFFSALVVSAIVSAFFSYAIKYVVWLIPHYAMYVSGTGKYSIFKEDGSGRIIVLYLFLFLVIILWMVAPRNNVKENLFNTKMLPAVIFGTTFGIFNCRNVLINRMLWYYVAIFISFIPSMINRYGGWLKRIITYGIVLGLYVYNIVSLLENQNGVVPYSFFWQ